MDNTNFVGNVLDNEKEFFKKLVLRNIYLEIFNDAVRLIFSIYDDEERMDKIGLFSPSLIRNHNRLTSEMVYDGHQEIVIDQNINVNRLLDHLYKEHSKFAYLANLAVNGCEKKAQSEINLLDDNLASSLHVLTLVCLAYIKRQEPEKAELLDNQISEAIFEIERDHEFLRLMILHSEVDYKLGYQELAYESWDIVIDNINLECSTSELNKLKLFEQYALSTQLIDVVMDCGEIQKAINLAMSLVNPAIRLECLMLIYDLHKDMASDEDIRNISKQFNYLVSEGYVFLDCEKIRLMSLTLSKKIEKPEAYTASIESMDRDYHELAYATLAKYSDNEEQKTEFIEKAWEVAINNLEQFIASGNHIVEMLLSQNTSSLSIMSKLERLNLVSQVDNLTNLAIYHWKLREVDTTEMLLHKVKQIIFEIKGEELRLYSSYHFLSSMDEFFAGEKVSSY